MSIFRQEPVVIIAAVQALLVFLAAFGFNLLSAEQTAALIGLIGSATVLIRGIVFSPASAQEIKEQREVLARGVKMADKEGVVNYRAAKTAKRVLDGVVDTVVPPGLIAEAIKLGLSETYVLEAGVDLTEQAIAALREQPKRTLTAAEKEVALDEQVAKRARP